MPFPLAAAIPSLVGGTAPGAGGLTGLGAGDNESRSSGGPVTVSVGGFNPFDSLRDPVINSSTVPVVVGGMVLLGMFYFLGKKRG